MTGKVWLVGAGPGDPGLLTQSGKAVLDAADTVIHDRLVSGEIIRSIPVGVELIDAGKYPSRHPLPQEEINRIMLAEARKGKRVVRLKGGDPFLFGRGGEEVLFLAARGIPCEVIPGVSSALAVPAAAGIPVTHRGISAAAHIIAWHGKDGPPAAETLKSIAGAGGTLVILMGAAALRRDMGERLTEAGFDPETPAAVIEEGATPRQRVRLTTLRGLAEAPETVIRPGAGSLSPALVVVGEVCSLREIFLRAEAVTEAPLRGLRVVVTRPEPQNAELCRNIRALGGEAIPFPCIKTLPSRGISDGACLEAGRYRWLLFTGAAGVEIFFERYLRGGGDFRSLGGCRFAAPGPATAEALAKHGFIPDFVPAVYNGRGLGEGLAEKIAPHEKALIICPEENSPGLFEALGERGVCFDKLAVYRTVPCEGGPAARKAIEDGDFDCVFFTSPSSAAAFVEAFPAMKLPGITALCIGETTAIRARELGMSVHTAGEATTRGMCRLAGELFPRP
ncbi:MAG: uroporphyrinogen-III C-methyltransferase [Spirochaetales bacterium]|jgi:uroporphyrinogen III methyltransferase/synthase|nr:uroporphyrinogen-III C-methyltransferase [Spirochaetales bacterium]